MQTTFLCIYLHKISYIVALPETYLSIKFCMIPTKVEDDISDSQSTFSTFFITPSGRTVVATALKFLSAIFQRAFLSYL